MGGLQRPTCFYYENREHRVTFFPCIQQYKDRFPLSISVILFGTLQGFHESTCFLPMFLRGFSERKFQQFDAYRQNITIILTDTDLFWLLCTSDQNNQRLKSIELCMCVVCSIENKITRINQGFACT